MRERLRLGAPLAIWAGAALLIAGLWAAGLHFIAADRAEAVDGAQREHANLAFTLGEQNGRALRNVESSLRAMAAEWHANGRIAALALPEARLVRRVIVVDAAGRIALDNNEVLDASRQEYFTAHRDNPSPALHIAAPIASRVSGETVIPVSVRVEDSRGRFAGVLVASLTPDYFSQLYGKPDLGVHGTVVLVGTDGVIRARRGTVAFHPGMSVSDSLVVQRQRAAPQGRLVTRGAFDGVRRYLSYATLEDFPSLFIAVGRDEADVLAAHRANVRVLVTLLAIASAIVLALAGVATVADARQRRDLGALAASEARYRDVYENAVEGIFRTTRDGRIVEANPAMARIMGFASPGELRAAGDARDFYGERQVRLTFQERMEREGAVEDFEYEVVRADGSTAWVSLNARAVRGAGGDITHYEGFVTDITARKREDAMRVEASELALRRYRQLLERLGVLAQTLAEAGDLAGIYRAVLVFAHESAPVDGMFVSLVEEERRMRRCVFAWSDGREEDVSRLPALPMTGSPHSRAVTTGCVVVTDDLQAALANQPHHDLGTDVDPRLPQSSLVVPLQVMGRVIGGLEVQSVEPRAYFEEHVVALQVAAPLVAMAIDNGRLLEKERAHRARAEHAERHNAAILDSAMDAIVTIDADDRVADFNPAAEALFGIQRAQALGRSIGNLVLPAWLRDEYGEILGACLREGRAGGTGARVETTGLRGDGTVFAVEISVTRIPGSDPPLLTAFLRDITERQRAVQALRQSEARYREAADELADVIDGSLDAICVFDADGRFLRVSAACQMIWGHAPEQLVGRPYVELVHPDDVERTRDCARRIMAGHPTRDFENRYVRPDGTVAHIMWSARWRADDGTLLAVARDVTQAKLMAEANRHLASRLHEALENLSSGFATLDRNWRITYVNRSGELLTRKSREEAVGRTLWEVLPALVGTGFEAKYRLAMDERVTIEFEDYFGELARWFEVRAYPTTDGGLAIYFHDVTSRRDLERQLMRTQRIESLGTLAGGIAHDLNNVFTPIMMGLDLLEADVASAEGADVVGMIRTSARRGAEMVKQVLHFARGIEGERVDVAPDHLLRELERMIRETFPRNIDIRVSCDAGAPSVSGDPTQLHQVLLNLCVNARDAMPDGGTLALRAREAHPREPLRAVNGMIPPGRYLVLEVQDQGCGIEGPVLEQIFDPFFTTKPHGEGTGLGLSTSLAIVRKHDGFVQVASEPRAGTRFSIYLPVRDALGQASAAEVAPDTPPGRGETILLVDDEAGIRHLARRALESAGYRVNTARDGAEGLAAFRANPSIDLVVTDMMMPVMDGAALARELHALAPELPVICTSGFAPSGLATGAGARASFIPKPYTAERLVAAVRDALPGRKAA